MFSLRNQGTASLKSKYLESQGIMMLITFSGGFQDAYSYYVRDRVFANAQTGNVVLLSGKLFSGDIIGAFRYFIPLFVFAMGVLVADQIRITAYNEYKINSMQFVAILEAALLMAVAFIPNSATCNMIANAIVSFCCAMQIETFKKVKGQAYASTMCIGNIRMAMGIMSKWIWSGSEKKKKEFLLYILVIVTFAVGAGIGIRVCEIMGTYAISISSLALLIAFFVLAIREKDDRED